MIGERLTVNQTLVTVPNRTQFSTPKTENGRRTIDLDPETVSILKTHKARQAEEKLAWGSAYQDSGLVFTRENGELIHPDGFGNIFKRLVREAGVPMIRLHDTRHTFAALALAAGVNVLVASKRLGHASVGFTLTVYGHLMPEQQKDAAAKVAAVIYGIP